MPPAKLFALLSTLAILPLAASPGAWANGDKGAPSRLAGLDDCASIVELVEQTLCYGHLAQQRDDLAVCQLAEHDGVRQQCIYMLAQHRNDAAVCRKISHQTLKHGCLSDVAEATLQPVLCAEITTANLQDSCRFKIARKSGDKALCGQIVDTGLKALCAGE